MYTIYALADPRTCEIRYIGQTQKHPSVRLQGHLKKEDGNKRKWAWLNELNALGIEPNVVVLEYADTLRNALAGERFWIEKGRKMGWPLLNFRVDGRQRRQLPIQTKAERVNHKPTMSADGWYEWMLSEYLPSHLELLTVDERGRGVGVMALARAMAEAAGGDVDSYKGLASDIAKRLRGEMRFASGDAMKKGS